MSEFAPPRQLRRWASSFLSMLPLFFTMMIALLAAFYLASRLIRIQHECHPDIWADDGKPADYFAQVRGSYMARMAVSTAWLFVTPDWMKSKSNARKNGCVVSRPMLYFLRWLDFDGVLAIETPMMLATMPNKSLDASGGGVFRKIIGRAMLE